jgi:hypothetical protein
MNLHSKNSHQDASSLQQMHLETGMILMDLADHYQEK